jgi:hypothetical protein
MILNGQQINFFDLFEKVGRLPFANIVEKISFSNNIGKFEESFKNGIIFKQYESFEEAYDEIQSFIKNPQNKAERNATDVFSDLKNFNSYKDFENALNEPSPSSIEVKQVTEDLLSNLKQIVNLGGSFKKSRIIITDDSRGIFDFSLASQGLFRPIEFYSPEYKQFVDSVGENEFSYLGEPVGVIPPQRVYKTKDSFGGYIYYFSSISNKDFTCVRRQKGTTSVFDNLSDMCFLKITEQGIEMPFSLKEPEKVFNGVKPYRLKYASSTKKAYLKFEKQSETTKFVDFFVPINFTYANDTNRILNVLPVILAASSLESFNIKVRINALRTGIVEDDIYETISMPVKEYDERTEEKIDFILNVFGKQRFAQKFFGALLIYNANKGEQTFNGKPLISPQFGPALNPLYQFRDASPEIFNRYKNWVEQNKNEKFVNSKVVNQNFQIFTTQFLEDDSNVPFFPVNKDTTSDIIAENLPYVMYLFYQYMDFLAIEFVPIPQFVQNILKRFEEDVAFRKIFTISNNRDEVKAALRKYIIDILVLKYHILDNYAYADSPSQAADKKEKKKSLIDIMDDTLKNF